MTDQVLDQTVAIHPTPMGTLVSGWTDVGLCDLRWATALQIRETEHVFGSRRFSDRVARLVHLLGDYFQIGCADFDSVTIDATGWTDFRSRVYQVCREIPAGQTRTYGELAVAVGSPGAARAVGAAMAANRTLLVIPCHRVIAASGKMQGFSGGEGIPTKQRLLALEQSSVRLPLWQ